MIEIAHERHTQVENIAQSSFTEPADAMEYCIKLVEDIELLIDGNMKIVSKGKAIGACRVSDSNLPTRTEYFNPPLHTQLLAPPCIGAYVFNFCDRVSNILNCSCQIIITRVRSTCEKVMLDRICRVFRLYFLTKYESYISMADLHI
jgi:hypothetical protein